MISPRSSAIVAFVSVLLLGCGGGGSSGGGQGQTVTLNGDTVEPESNGQRKTFDLDYRETASEFPNFLVEFSETDSYVYASRNTRAGNRDVLEIVATITDSDPNFPETSREVIHVDSSGAGFFVERPGAGRASDANVSSGVLPVAFPATLSVGQTFGDASRHRFEGGGQYREFSRLCSVVAVETVQVPAGQFEAFRVQCQERGETGRTSPTTEKFSDNVFDITTWVHPRFGIVLRREVRNFDYQSGGTGRATAEYRLVTNSRIQ